MVPSRELVPGDVVRLRIGDIVPADARLFEGDPVELDQSALTGESLPVSRAVGGVAFSGSILKRGEADALVYATGSASYFGRTASLVKQPRAVSHFQRAVLKIGDFLILLALVLVVFILAVALHRGSPIARTLEFALVLTVAAIPVAMPTVLSVTMALGARVLARAQAIVSRLVSIEELAGMDLLCSDKTGTLTQNRLTLGTPALLGAASAEEVSACAALAARAEDQDPIDLAVLGGAGASGPPRGFTPPAPPGSWPRARHDAAPTASVAGTPARISSSTSRATSPCGRTPPASVPAKIGTPASNRCGGAA